MDYQITRVSIIDQAPKSSSSHDREKQELAKRLNFNSVLFNTIYTHGTNLLDHSTRFAEYKKTDDEKLELKKAKKEYKKYIKSIQHA